MFNQYIIIIHMTRIIHYVFLLIFTGGFLSCSDEKQNSIKEERYVITGEVTGFPEGSILYLKSLSTEADIDSAVIRNEHFQMRGYLEYPPEQLWIHSQVDGDFVYTNLLMGNDSIKIKADLDDFPWKVQVGGSEFQEEYTDARKRTRTYDIERDSLTSYFISMNQEERQNQGKEIWARIDEIDSITFLEKVQYLKSNNTYISIIDLGYLKDKLPRDTVQQIFNQYSEDIRNSKYGKILEVFLKEKTISIGDSFYDFEAINQEDEKIKFSSIHDNTKFTLIDFTSTFCGPCIKAADELASVHQTFKDSLTVVSFSGDPKKESWLKGVERDSVAWNSLWDGKGRFSETAIHYGIRGFPTFVLINPEGLVVDRWTGYSEGNLMEHLKKFL